MKLGNKAEAEKQLSTYFDKEEKLESAYQENARRYADVPGKYHTDTDIVALFLLNRTGKNDLSLPWGGCPFYEYSHYYYAAEKALSENDKESAVEYLRKYLSYIKPDLLLHEYMVTGLPDSIYLSLVQHELKALGQ